MTGRCVSSKAEKITARALGRVLARNVAAGRSVEYPELLLETEAEIAAMLDKRRKRQARMLRRAEKAERQIRQAQIQIAAQAIGSPGDIDREFRSLDMALGPPSWHPENPEHDL